MIANIVSEVGFAVACMVLPILWGWVVHLAYSRWRSGREANGRGEDSFIDYYI